ncbi:MAG: CoA pyrophosphatase [Planctomycetota bacterium]|nr:MAG: CoA pyrophosphatase [Planctomycetota bacterium]
MLTDNPNLFLDFLQQALAEHPKKKLKKDEKVPAAVFLVLKYEKGKWWILFVEKSKELEHHGGQISFPGGRQKPGETNLLETGLRELEEEVGICEIQVLGKLGEHATYVTPYIITPFVGWIKENPSIQLDTRELVDFFWAPLPLLLQPETRRIETWQWENRLIPMPFYDYQGKTIWGATARILDEFLSLLKKEFL